MAVEETGDDGLKLPSTSGINLTKVEPGTGGKVDENFAVMMGKCQTTGKPYLVKFARRFGNPEDIEDFIQQGFRLVGTYPIDEAKYAQLSDGKALGKNINTNLLYGRLPAHAAAINMGSWYVNAAIYSVPERMPTTIAHGAVCRANWSL